MAYKWVDETKLNAALTASADAIREKTGDTAQINFDMENETGFSEAVESIPSGGAPSTQDAMLVALGQLVSNYNYRGQTFLPQDLSSYPSPLTINMPNATTDMACLFQGWNFPEKLIINATNFISKNGEGQGTYYAFRNATGVKELELYFNNSCVNLMYLLRQFNTVEKLILHFSTTNVGGNTHSFTSAFSGTALKEIVGTIDFSNFTQFGVWSVQPFELCSSLEKVTIGTNSIKFPFDMHWSPNLTDNTIVSVANGLNNDSPNTLTLHTVPYARCSAIVGTVSGGIFTMSASGTVTLADFITQTKGWTLVSA